MFAVGEAWIRERSKVELMVSGKTDARDVTRQILAIYGTHVLQTEIQLCYLADLKLFKYESTLIKFILKLIKLIKFKIL